MRAVIAVGHTSAVRAVVEGDTAGWRAVRATWVGACILWGWSSEDGYRSQCSDEESEEGGEMHAGDC